MVLLSVIAILAIVVGSALGYAVCRLSAKRLLYWWVKNHIIYHQGVLNELEKNESADCQSPSYLISAAKETLQAVDDCLNGRGLPAGIASPANKFPFLIDRVGFVAGLIRALDDGVYPLIGRWKKADADLFAALEPLVDRDLRSLFPLIDGGDAEKLRSRFMTARKIAMAKPRVGLELLTKMLIDLDQLLIECSGRRV